MSFTRRAFMLFGLVLLIGACSLPDPATSFEASAVDAGDYHSLRIDPVGNVLAWGYNAFGQLGDGTTTQQNTPTQLDVPPGTVFTTLAAGDYHSVAIDPYGAAWAWGVNNDGRLGDGTLTDRIVPTAVAMPVSTTFQAVAAGYRHTVAIDQDGNAWAWGSNGDGQLGDGTTTQRSIPTLAIMPAGRSFVAIAAGEYHSVALDDLGHAWAWGYNNYGQAGDGTTTSHPQPSPVSMPLNTSFVSISANADQTLALDQDGNAWAWGYNNQGQLGDGTTTNRATPTPVATPPNTTFAHLAAGTFHTVAVDQNGNAWAWGYNNQGQLGDGTTTDAAAPSPVSMPLNTSFVSVAAGYWHSLAIDQNGNTWSWGYNADGQLGDGTTTSRSVPTPALAP